jgi:hypothetical protein
MTCCLYPDGNVVTVVDVLHITHAAIATVSVNFLLLGSSSEWLGYLVHINYVFYAHASRLEVSSHFYL